jgi:hypothetical protein
MVLGPERSDRAGESRAVESCGRDPYRWLSMLVAESESYCFALELGESALDIGHMLNECRGAVPKNMRATTLWHLAALANKIARMA